MIPSMRPTLLMTCLLWITFALCVAVLVMGGTPRNGLETEFVFAAIAALVVLNLAIHFTRCYRSGIAFPFVKGEPLMSPARRRRSRTRPRRSPR